MNNLHHGKIKDNLQRCTMADKDYYYRDNRAVTWSCGFFVSSETVELPRWVLLNV